MDPKLIISSNASASNASHSAFNQSVQNYAESRGISFEEALDTAITELQQLDDETKLAEIKANLESSIIQAQEAEAELENPDEKEKYPYLNLMQKLD